MDLLARAIVYVELLLSAALLLPIAAALGVISLALRGLDTVVTRFCRRMRDRRISAGESGEKPLFIRDA